MSNTTAGGKTPAERKWGDAVAAGFQIVPNVLIRRQNELGLSSSDMMVLLNILTYWQEVANMPYPRVSTIAQRMGKSHRTVERHLVRLESKGYIRRVRDAQAEVLRFDLTGLVEKLQTYGREAAAYRQLAAVNQPDEQRGENCDVF